MKRVTIILSLLLLVGLIAFICIKTHKPSNYVTTSHSGIVVKCERYIIPVPENRSKSVSRTISVEVVRLVSSNPRPKTPIFYLAGGPGDGAISQSTHPYWLDQWTPHLKERDVILINQRGVGNLFMWWIQFRPLPKDIFAKEEVAINHVKQSALKAIEDFKDRNIDLSGYNSLESAKDIDKIRQFFGYEKIIPFGFSYGTHLGLTYIKYFGKFVEQSILVGVEGLGQTFKRPLDLDKQLHLIDSLVNTDSTKQIAVVDLYKRLSIQLENEPIQLTIQTPLKYHQDIYFGKFGLDYIFKRDLGDASDIPNLVRLLQDIPNGNYELLRFYIEKRYREFMTIPGMHLSMDLASGYDDNRMNEIEQEAKQSLFSSVNNFPYIHIKDFWPSTDLGTNFREAFTTETPTLLVSGSLDTNTPAYQAEEIKQKFTNATHLIVENAGHEQIVWHREFKQTVVKFLNGDRNLPNSLSFPKLKFKTI